LGQGNISLEFNKKKCGAQAVCLYV